MNTCNDDIRSDAALRHFASRAQQPKVLAASPRMYMGDIAPPPVQIIVAYEQPFGSSMDQMDDMRFRYTGTSTQVSKDEKMCARRTSQLCMQGMYQ